MRTRGRALKLTAVVAMMGLALTGFSTGRGHGHKSRSDGGGGGCSSSSQNHGGSSSYNGSYNGSNSGGTSGGTGTGGSSRTLRDGTARLVSCASDARPYATVAITNPNHRRADFQARVTFYDDKGTTLYYSSSVTVTVPADGTANTRVELAKSLATSVARCAADPEAEVSP
ncbi:hypothetical protein SLINC_3726 [Streptomyces lincolnensis]|uniref:Uncharacterized protein n=1 Tax=Streptomyces lincolnensis TaxID=1915 RepID=A0A1B1MBF6_STRLN|nr:hypothetical protein [Streptomyces lincolnensis]ANS65950.1 hypothetical protein SLINC_3726 [Streptomyces lincolnensis]AXG54287.1 hypothetical protein SLCG_3132 [Streptomyces lincolnensis]QMV08660.1 hypothetical protein GJU35_25465 [Streptomyces lincolnensis]